MRNDALPILHAKIVMCSPQHFHSLGLMTVEDVREKILMGKHSVLDCQVAVDECCKKGFLDCYYKWTCSQCGEVVHTLETDYEHLRSSTEMLTKGHRCPHCYALERLSGPLEKVYTIPNRYMGTDTKEELEKAPETLLKSLFNFIFFWRKNG